MCRPKGSIMNTSSKEGVRTNPLPSLSLSSSELRDKYEVGIDYKEHSVLCLIDSKCNRTDQITKVVGIHDQQPYFEEPSAYKEPCTTTQVIWNKSLEKFIAFIKEDGNDSSVYLADYNDDHSALDWNKLRLHQNNIVTEWRICGKYYALISFNSLLFIFTRKPDCWIFVYIDLLYGDEVYEGSRKNLG